MNIFEDLRTALLGMSAVTALVGSGSSARIWNSWPRTYTVPCIVIDVDQETPANDLSGKGGLVFAAVVVTCRDDDQSDSHALAEAVRLNGTNPGTGLAGYSGTFDAILDNGQHAEVPKGDGSTAYWYDHVLDCTLIWSEAT